MKISGFSSEESETENRLQKAPHLAVRVGMLLIIALCISCSNEQSSSSFIRERVENLKKQTVPSDASVRETEGISQNEHSVSAQWEFNTSKTREDYSDWVTHRLQHGYQLKSSGESGLVFGNHLDSDYESVKFETTPTKESLRVKVTYVIFPD
jgi:hypothetical protein